MTGAKLKGLGMQIPGAKIHLTEEDRDDTSWPQDVRLGR